MAELSFERPYLIQRMRIRQKTNSSKGIDSYFQMDYMGAAEFEFGALPKSLKRIRNDIDHYIITKIPNIKNSKNMKLALFYDSRKNLLQYSEYLLEIIEEKLHLKEYCNINDYIKGYKRSYIRGREIEDIDQKSGYNMWWDIENDVFFTFRSEYIDLLIKGLKNP